MTSKCDDVLGVTLGIDKTQLAGFIGRTFGPEPRDNFQKSLACLYCSEALLVQDELYRYEASFSWAYLKCMQSDDPCPAPDRC